MPLVSTSQSACAVVCALRSQNVPSPPLHPFSPSFSFYTNEAPGRRQHPLLPWAMEMDFSRSRLWTAPSEGDLAIRCLSLSHAGGCFSLSQPKISEWDWIRSTSDN